MLHQSTFKGKSTFVIENTRVEVITDLCVPQGLPSWARDEILHTKFTEYHTMPIKETCFGGN